LHFQQLLLQVGDHLLKLCVRALQLNVVSSNGEVVDADELVEQLRVLKAAGVDGVMVDCWWGIIEANKPQEYNWTDYKRLFQTIRELKLKLQVSITRIPVCTKA
jgi:hypothetical protein